ncbi:HK97 family phage prohead protease [Bradyrhizobium japonicum]|jgi:HK97 family phage prohead protease|uniref:HK97 family phage prohead protease n=1 Tax=Bradyrhizobium TaxID=374 RepID=UPI000481F777|nr:MULTISPECIES: HK97 family phage prohead protease [Bradyrhizobium]MBR0884529.1 HK97 family phage prohead protease [Bradyrhizobium liaoningense]MBR0947664.1 HK97 family phage prohead protease [Bradyrhizobium liaoningense]MBR1004770.1 HK97 family phage prohead protease [Bradyrhizobium liaoningense]MBR1071043.1 HK97 family phage prohead protease [Bradyrhizobium liaoningense]MCP1738782.1 HK97 family phage prohead protease [Bradyrhizobium japonicum]
MIKRDYEIAAGGPIDLEYGGGGFVSAVDGKSIAPSDGGEVRQHLQGYALRWRSLIEQNGNYFYFLPHAIKNPMWGEAKRLLFDHNEGEVIATTLSGLQLHCDDHGLAMRLVIGDDPARRKAYETVKSGERTALSVGVTMRGEFVEVDDIRVKMVKNAALHEISLVGSGACKPAFCGLVDADASRSLVMDSKTARILNDGAARDFMRALQKVAEAFEHNRR